MTALPTSSVCFSASSDATSRSLRLSSLRWDSSRTRGSDGQWSANGKDNTEQPTKDILAGLGLRQSQLRLLQLLFERLQPSTHTPRAQKPVQAPLQAEQQRGTHVRAVRVLLALRAVCGQQLLPHALVLGLGLLQSEHTGRESTK